MSRVTLFSRENSYSARKEAPPHATGMALARSDEGR
jgi:hypothetical protein